MAVADAWHSLDEALIANISYLSHSHSGTAVHELSHCPVGGGDAAEWNSEGLLSAALVEGQDLQKMLVQFLWILRHLWPAERAKTSNRRN